MSDENSKQPITFLSKTETDCPVCGLKFRKEEMMTGGGRLNAGDLTEELRRLYIPSKKYGEINPLIYYITTCPDCLFSASASDFSEVKAPQIAELKANTEDRISSLESIFDSVDFKAKRTLIEGIASYYLAVMALDSFTKDMSPTVKGGIYCLRSAWLCNDLHAKFPSENYDYMAELFYKKATFYYVKALDYEQDGSEGIGGAKNLGPDLDKNYCYDGVLYVGAYLQYKYASIEDEAKHKEALANAKRIVAKIFGMGKASKNKPAAILDNAKDLYDKIKNELKDPSDE
ncbi:MAG: DUF2225 domain-containing protein [Spirochaetaceae bacterium]|nr:DUF2225 domain-containing protein [Spirochaetaceae bacterium]